MISAVLQNVFFGLFVVVFINFFYKENMEINPSFNDVFYSKYMLKKTDWRNHLYFFKNSVKKPRHVFNSILFLIEYSLEIVVIVILIISICTKQYYIKGSMCEWYSYGIIVLMILSVVVINAIIIDYSLNTLREQNSMSIAEQKRLRSLINQEWPGFYKVDKK